MDGASGLPVLVAGFVVYSLGLAPVFTLATDLIVGTAPPERAGAAAAISETGSELGGALGIAILRSMGTAVYRGLMADAIPPGVAREVTDAALHTLGGAMATARQLPAPLAEQLIVAARDAFTAGLRAAAVTSALAALGLTVLVAVLLRHVRAGSDPHLPQDLGAAT